MEVPLEYLQNRPTIPRWERQICKENKTLYECALELREAGFIEDSDREEEWEGLGRILGVDPERTNSSVCGYRRDFP